MSMIVNGGHNKVAQPSAYFTSDEAVKVNLKKDHQELIMTWENVNVHAPPESSGPLRKLFKKNSTGAERKHIIQNVNGIAKPGQVMAIMGASGAGKTTLLNVLTFRNQGELIISGEIKVNGKRLADPKQLASISGYVQQSDIFIGTLKVKEHLRFQAMLRMENATKEEKFQRVEEILNDLNLKKCEDTLIGVAQLGIKGISGGEMRRLAFASEIITNPGILFCDEPTSGLDSFMAISIVETMKNLANQGRTIICTIHQPSSEIFEKFDTLYLMAEGRLAYMGQLSMALGFFDILGYKCPTNYNPSDFYIKTLAIEPNNREVCKEKVKRICDAFDSSNLNTQMMNEIVECQPKSPLDQKSATFISQANTSYKTNSFTQLTWLVWRSFTSSSRNPMETRIMIIQTLFIAIMFGLIFLQIKLDQQGVQNINGVLFLLLTNSSFSNIFGVVNTFPAEIPIFIREHGNSMYRVVNYYLSKFIIELPKYIIFPALFTTIVYWMCGLNPDFGKFMICVASIVLVANCAVSFGSMLSALAPNVNAALALAAPILVPLMIFSGYFLNNDSIPVYFIWIKYISWISYANEILIVNQWKDVTDIPCPGIVNGTIISNSTKCFTNGKQVIEALSMNENNFVLDFILLGVLVAAFRTLACLFLFIKAYFKK